MGFRLAFDKGDDDDFYDTMTFKLDWDHPTGEKPSSDGWTCTDGYMELRPNEKMKDNVKNNGDGKIKGEDGQDCVVLRKESKITPGETRNDKGVIMMRFRRQLSTRGQVKDRLLKIGEKYKLYYAYRMNHGNKQDRMAGDPLEITISKKAKILALTALASISAIVYFY